MTTTTNAPATTAQGALELTTAKSWAEVYRAAQVAEVKAAGRATTGVETPLPKALALTDGERSALSGFADQALNLALPGNRRMMTLDELKANNAFLNTVKTVQGLIKRTIEDTLRPTFFNHFDVMAEKDGVADPVTTPRNKDGYYLLEDKKSGKAEGLPASAVREYRSGQVSLTVEGLKALEDAGEIDRTTFLSLTAQVRVVDEGKVMAAIRKNPELVGKLRKATSAKSPSVALTIR